MGVFKDMLSGDQTLFKNEVALDFSFIPKLVPYREKQQKFVAGCLNPLFGGRSGQNILIHGIPGVGKTVAVRHILLEIEEKTDEILCIYINCWQRNTIHKVVTEMCEQLGLNIISNQKTDEIFKKLVQYINKKSLVLVLDEVDKLEDYGLIYSIIEEIYRKSIVLITNHKEWIIDLDKRIKSRLVPQVMEFPPYNETETLGILRQRVGYAFIPDSWEEDALRLASRKAYELKDIRTGLTIIRQSGQAAELRSSRSVSTADVVSAIKNFSSIPVNDSEELDEETKFILKIIKDHSGEKMGDLYKSYSSNGGKGTYKTFQRKISKLSDGKFISIKKIIGGTAGSTTLVSYIGKKSLKDY